MDKKKKEIGYELQFKWHSEPESEDSESFSPVRRKYRRIKRLPPSPVVVVKPHLTVHSFFVTGVEKITLSTATQETLGCLAGSTLTFEYPWMYVSKESIQNNIKFDPFSEFIELSEIIEKFPNPQILIIFIPNDDIEEQEFYICLTVEAEEIVSNLCEQMLIEREKYYKSIGSKTARPWRSLGSDLEILGSMNINSRPLIEVEVGTIYPMLDTPTHFHLRMVEDAHDGYIEVLSRRSRFKNTNKRRIDISAQSTPMLNAVSCQSSLPYPTNISTQYEYTYLPPEVDKEWLKTFNFFTHYKADHIFDSININSYFDFYTNDYGDLVKNQQHLTKAQPALLTEFASLYPHTLEKHKMVSAVCWHPMWTGVVAISYGNCARNIQRKSKPMIDETLSCIFNVTPVLLWSFADTLVPSLFLESPREITALSFCPYNESILIGGCVNGQIIMWDLTNRLKRAEEDKVLTSTQRANRTRIQYLMRWMKNTYDPKVVRPTVISDLTYSHKSFIMEISWVSPFNEISRAGKVNTLPKDPFRSSLQFTTVSLDGSILVWNLGGASSSQNVSYVRRSGRLKEAPEALRTDTSPFKSFNRVLKPIFIGNVVNPTTLKPIPISIVARPNPPVSYVKKEIELNTRHDKIREYYEPVLHSSSNIKENSYVLGTITGDFLMASWEGLNFKSSEFIASESCTVSNFVKFHDGVVVSLNVCAQRNDLILSVGGKIFALWLLDYPNKPIIWKKSTHTYTFGKWSLRPSVIALSRSDGCLEVWNFSVQSNRCQFIRPLSREPIIGLYLHTLPLKRDVVGITDYTQALRLYFIDQNLKVDYSKDTQRFHNVITNELRKKLTLDKWTAAWNEKYVQLVALKKKKLLEARQKKNEARADLTEKEHQAEDEGVHTAEAQKESYPIWKKKELERMNIALLGRRGVDVDVIKEQQKPLIQIQKESKEKQKKIELYSKQSENIFDDMFEKNFHEILEEEPIPAPDPYGGGDYIKNSALYFDDYKNIENIYGKYVTKNKYQYDFNWLNLLQSGKERRKLLDVWKERSAHKSRLIKEKYVPVPKHANILYSLDTHIGFDDEEGMEMETESVIEKKLDEELEIEKEIEPEKEKEDVEIKAET